MATIIVNIISVFVLIGIVALRVISIRQRTKEENIQHDEKSDNWLDNFINSHYKIILAIFLVLVFITRIYKFGETPSFIQVDEAGAAYDAYCLAEYGIDRYQNSYPLYLINFGGGQSALYAYATIPFIKLFGANIVAYRLPELLFFLMGILVCYILINKVKDKKTALLYTFLIIISPWNIEASRQGLDCNLLAPMFMLDLLLLINAKKNYQYIIAGISIGSLVIGFMPILALCVFTSNKPKPAILIDSPFSNPASISSNTVSTAVVASFFVILALAATASIMLSLFITIFSLIYLHTTTKSGYMQYIN